MTLRADARRNHDRLLQAAAECFAERGLDCSIDEIARRAGVGHGTVFRRFPGKDALVVEVLAERVRELTAVARSALEHDDAAAGFSEFVRFAAETYARNRALVEGADLCAGRPEQDELLRVVRKLVRRAQQAGGLRREVDAEDVLRLVPTAASYPEIVLAGLRPE